MFHPCTQWETGPKQGDRIEFRMKDLVQKLKCAGSFRAPYLLWFKWWRYLNTWTPGWWRCLKIYETFTRGSFAERNTLLGAGFEVSCWEPCGLVSDQYVSACSMGLHMGIVSFRKDQWTLGQCTIRGFRVILQACVEPIWSFLEIPLFFSQIFSPKILCELMLLRLLV